MSVLRFDLLGDPFRHMDRLTNQLLSGTRTPLGMPMDAWQTDDGIPCSVWTCPAWMRTVWRSPPERNILTITAERRAEYRAGPERADRRSGPQGTFTRRVAIGRHGRCREHFGRPTATACCI